MMAALALSLALALALAFAPAPSGVRAAAAAAAAAPLELDRAPSSPADLESLAKQFQEKAQRDFEEFKKRSGFRELEPVEVGGLKPRAGEHVFAEQESSVREWSSVDGVTSERAAAHAILNDDGQVQEFDYKS